MECYREELLCKDSAVNERWLAAAICCIQTAKKKKGGGVLQNIGVGTAARTWMAAKV